ncbi:MAG: hypothetical protein K2G38_05480 [Clostridia bacterium]|nr:hypothetical protein [Clostridia bacterium]
MKLNKRNFLTVILAVLCAVLLSVGISFMLPKNEVKTAYAEEALKVTPTIEFGTPRYIAAGAPGTTLTDCNFTSLSTTEPLGFSNYKATNSADSEDKKGSVGVTIASLYYADNFVHRFMVVPIIMKVKVPAHTVYTVKYTPEFGATPGAHGKAQGVYETWKDASDGNYDMELPLSTMAVSALTTGWKINADNGNTGSSELKAIFYNDKDDEKEISLYSFYYAKIGDGCTTPCTSSFSVSISGGETEVTKIGVPTATDTEQTYDETTKTFEFKYDIPTITQNGATVKYKTAYEDVKAEVEEALDYDGDAIEESTYTLSNIKENGTFKALNAGKYKVKFTLTDDAIANGIKWKDNTTGEQYITFEIKRKAVDVPTILNSTKTYKADEYEFALKDYDKDLMSVKSYTSNNNNSSITWDDTDGAEKFKATNAATYTVKFQMDSKNHIWKVDGSESADDQERTITINKKELTINTTPAANSSPIWDYQATGSISVTVTASGIANPDFVLNIYYVKTTDTNNYLTDGWDADTKKLDVSQIEASGKYKLCIELTGASANKNYCIKDDKFEMPFEIKSGGIDFKKISWTYKEGSGNAAALFNDGEQAEIRYKQDDKKNAIKYYILGDIPDGEYLKIDTSYNSNGYKNGFLTTKAGASFNDGCSAVGTYKTRVALISDTDHLFKSGTNCGSFGGDDTKGWYEIEWEIKKGKVDSKYLDNLNKYLEYKVAGGPLAGQWQTYDPDKPPQYGNGSIEIRLNPEKYPAGITDAEIFVNNKNTQISESDGYTAKVKFTYDDNYENEGNKEFKWQIVAKVIDVDWTSTFWKDGDGNDVLDENSAPYQIRELNIDDDLKQYIDYKYYIADPNDPMIRGTYIGMNEAGLKDLIGAPYNASSTNAVYVYVEAVLKSTATQYQLKDDTGNDYPNCTLFKLGATNTLVKVTLSATEMGYGDDKLKTSIISMFDTEAKGELNQNVYVEGIYIYDSEKNNLGLLKDFDGTKAAVGVYTIVIKLNAAGEETYTLSPGSKYTFTVKAKAIPVPTVSDITFNNDFINFTDYLGGSWADYKDIIKVGGTFDGVKNANTPYVATLTLTDTNYCWDYSKGITPISFSLTANEMTCTGTDTVATYNWVINPYVLDASNWNLKGKNGAVYNIPANLISGLDVNVNYLYHTDKAGSALEEGASLSAGSTYFVKAELVGADAGNFVFKETGNSVSDFAQYKLPQSGIAAFGGKVLSFLKNYWWWILIALAILILLIILIVVLVKRRKNKEEREEKKRQKEEEKERKEEEKRRREEEREEEKRRREEEREEEKRRREEEREREKAEREAERERQKAELEAEKERQKAELELAKAKQEAELAKMKAEAAATAGMAGVAVAAQPQQQAVAQPAQQVIDNTNNELLKEMREQMAELRAENRALQQQKQQQPVPQPQPQPQYNADPNALARLEAEMAAMRAENKAMHQSMQQQQQMPVAQPMVMPMQQPMMQMPMQMQQPMMQMPMMQQPSYGPMPSYGGNGGSADNGALARVEAQLNALQAQQRAKDEAEHRAEMSAMRAEMKATKEAEQTAEFAALRNQMLYGSSNNNTAQPALNAIPVIQAQPQQANNNPNSMDMLGALVVAALKNIAEPKANESKPMEQRIVEVEPPVAVNTPTVYPPDAVVTTTTRVDTTKPQPQQTRSRDDGRLFDVDGFYDSFEGNK